MCFSATASFGASAILTVAGVAAVSKAESKSQIPFAIIPFIFAFQQFTEGFVWLSLSNLEYSYLKNISILIFILIAQVIWPFWVPFAFLLIQKDEKRKMVSKILFGFGIIVCIFLAYRIFFYPISATINPYHIHYDINFPYYQLSIIASIFYFLATIVPPFLAGTKRMIILGLLNLSSFLVTILFFEDYIISVWCFFGGLMSIEVFYAIKELNEKHKSITTQINYSQS